MTGIYMWETGEPTRCNGYDCVCVCDIWLRWRGVADGT